MELKYGSRNKGLTLIEALIWFAIFAAVVAGVFSLYSSSRNANNVSTVNKELSTIFAKTEQLYASDDTAILDNSIGLQLGIFPSSLKVKGVIINNVFGGTVGLAGQTPSGFSVTYNKVPSGEVCSKIVKTQKIVGWSIALTDETTIIYNKDYSVSQVTILCGDNGSGIKGITFARLNTST